MNDSRKAQAIAALSDGSELLNCILHDSRTWMKILGSGITKHDARTFLLNRIYQELEVE